LYLIRIDFRPSEPPINRKAKMNWYDHQTSPEEEEELQIEPKLLDYIFGIFIFVGFSAAVIFFIIKVLNKIGGN